MQTVQQPHEDTVEGFEQTHKQKTPVTAFVAIVLILLAIGVLYASTLFGEHSVLIFGEQVKYKVFMYGLVVLICLSLFLTMYFT